MQAVKHKKICLTIIFTFIISFNIQAITLANLSVVDQSGSSEISIENNLPQNSPAAPAENFIPAEILLTEVNFKNSEEDFLKFTVKSSDGKAINLRGLEFYDDKVFKTIEQDFHLKSGDQITLFFNLDQPDNPTKKEIYSTHTGLTATTEQIILKQNQHYFDYLCWQKSPISKSEQLDFQKTFQKDFWDKNDITTCLDSAGINKDQSIFRQNIQQNDQAWSAEQNGQIAVQENTTDQSDTDSSTAQSSEYFDLYQSEDSQAITPISTKSSQKSAAKSIKKSPKKSSSNTLAQEIADLGPEQIPDNPEDPAILITEIMPAPIKAKDSKTKPAEWIEIHNQSGQDIDLSGWIIDDSDGGSKPHLLDSQIIKADQYLILPASLTKLNLNNSSDQVRLFDPQKNLIDALEYQEAEKNSSYARISIDNSSEWNWQKIPTPGSANPVYISLKGTIISAPLFEQIYHFQIEVETSSATASIDPASTKQQYQIIFDEQTIKAPLAKNIFTPGTTGKFIGQIIAESDTDTPPTTTPTLQLSQYLLDQTDVPTNNNSLPTIIIVTILMVGVCIYYLIKNKKAWISGLSGKSPLPS